MRLSASPASRNSWATASAAACTLRGPCFFFNDYKDWAEAGKVRPGALPV